MATPTTAVTELAAALLGGRVEVVDLTATLGPETPLIKLPPETRAQHAASRDPHHFAL